MTAVCDCRVNEIDFLINEIAEHIHGVDSLVYDNAAAFLVPCALPVTAGVVLIASVPCDGELCGLDLAEFAAVKQVFDKNGSGVVTVLENASECDVVSLCGVDHCLCVLQFDGHGLFGQNVDAALFAVDSDDRMEIVREAEMNDVGLFLVDHFLIVKIILATELFGFCLCSVLLDVADGNKLCFGAACYADCVHGENVAAADDTGFKLFHKNILFVQAHGTSERASPAPYDSRAVILLLSRNYNTIFFAKIKGFCAKNKFYMLDNGVKWVYNMMYSKRIAQSSANKKEI